MRRFDRGQRDHEHRLRIVKRRRRVEPQVHFRAVRVGKRGDVLVLCGVKRGQDLADVDGGRDVGVVQAGGYADRGAGLQGEIARGAAQESLRRVDAAVVEDERALALLQAGGLLIGGALEAVLVELERERPGERLGFRLDLVRVLDRAQGLEVGVDAFAVQAGQVQVLGRAHKGSGPASHRALQRRKVTAGLRREQNHDLLGTGRDDQVHALLLYLLVPGFDLVEPAVRGRIGGPAQKRGYHQVVDGLVLAQYGVKPQAVAGLQVGHLADGQGLARALHLDLERRTLEVELGVLRARRGGGGDTQQGQNCTQQGKMSTPRGSGVPHTRIVDANGLAGKGPERNYFARVPISERNGEPGPRSFCFAAWFTRNRATIARGTAAPNSTIKARP